MRHRANVEAPVELGGPRAAQGTRVRRGAEWFALRVARVGVDVAVGVAVVCVGARPALTQQAVLLYQNQSLSFEARAKDLVGRMTLEEKVLQMKDVAPAIPRLNVPEYNRWNEALHGVARSGLATVFPQAIGMAATWDDSLMFHMAIVVSDEARAKHEEYLRTANHQRYQGLTFWSPNISLFRDPRWGRGQETYGEDPFLTGQLGVQFIRGLQGDDPKYFKTVATVKHFAVHSGPEPERHSFDAVVSERDLRESYLPHFDPGYSRGRCVFADVRLQPDRWRAGVRQRHAAQGHLAGRMEISRLRRLRLRRKPRRSACAPGRTSIAGASIPVSSTRSSRGWLQRSKSTRR